MSDKKFRNPVTESVFSVADIKRMFDDIMVNSPRLNEWESNFIDSLQNQFDLKESMSPRQLEIFERIYAEKT